jgi:hypothetical protein
MDAKIVSAWVQHSPDFGFEKVMLSRNPTDANVLHVRFPYLNEGQQVTIRILSVENNGLTCNILVAGAGLEGRLIRRAGTRPRLMMLPILPLSLGITAYGVGIAKYGFDNDPGTSEILQDFPVGTLILGMAYGGAFLFGVTSISVVMLSIRALRRQASIWR